MDIIGLPGVYSAFMPKTDTKIERLSDLWEAQTMSPEQFVLENPSIGLSARTLRALASGKRPYHKSVRALMAFLNLRADEVRAMLAAGKGRGK